MQKVLVVDDETFVVDIVKTTLSRAGYDVVTARDGVTGLAIAGDEQPSLVLLDADMPRLDGFEALERLQRDGRTNAIPVVMMTGRRTEADVRRGIALGARATWESLSHRRTCSPECRRQSAENPNRRIEGSGSGAGRCGSAAAN